MINENKCVFDLNEDELSTSAGGSDTEVAASPRSTSGSDNENVAAETPCDNVNSAKKGLVKELIRLPLAVLLELLFFLFGTSPAPLQPAQTLATGKQTEASPMALKALAASTRKASGRSCFRSEPALQGKRGEDVLASGASQRFLLKELGLEGQRVLLEKIGAPPGLEGMSGPPALPARSRPNARRPCQAKQPSTPPPPPPPVAPLPPPVLLEFEQAAYRKELSQVLKDLAHGSNVGACVRRIRIQSVPIERQAQEFTDIMTRACEEHRGVVRRLSFAFAVGLSNGAFEREECAFGLMNFFEDVFEDLASEVPRLRNKIANEFVPTLRTVFSEEDIGRLIPADCRSILG